MRPPPGDGSPHTRRPHVFWTITIHPWPLLVWAGAQSLALLLAAANAFPAAWPSIDHLAIHAWVVAQWLLLACYFPDLLATVGTTVAAIALIWPYGVLAGVLAGGSRGVTAVSIHQSVWVAALAGCHCVLGNGWGQQTAGRVVRAWIFGGALLAYLLADQSPPTLIPNWLLHIDPLLATETILSAGSSLQVLRALILPLAVTGFFATYCIAIARYSRRSAVTSGSMNL